MANWNWTEEEKILVADLADDRSWRGFNKTTEGVAGLSALLRSTTAFYPLVGRPDGFRNLNGVALKASNLIAWHPDRTALKGTRRTLAELPLVEAFVLDRDRMKRLAAEIRERISDGTSQGGLNGAIPRELENVDSGAAEAAEEGGLRAVVSYRRERDSKLRERKLEVVEASGRVIACEVCEFDFERSYGERGRGYIEVHHVTPLHVSGVVETRLEDLVLLCANCHRMVHRSGWIRPEELGRLLQA